VPTKPSEISTILSKSASLSVPHIIIERDKAEHIKGPKLEVKNSIDSDVRMDDVWKLFTASCEASKFAKATVDSYIDGILPVSKKANQPTPELNNLKKAPILLQSKPEEEEVDASEMMSQSLPNTNEIHPSVKVKAIKEQFVTNNVFPISDETLPFMEPMVKQSVGMRTSMVESMMTIVPSPLLSKDASSDAFFNIITHSDNNHI